MNKVAYLILANSDPMHLNKLVNSINYKCDIYIHVDVKSNIEIFKKEISNLENIYFIENRRKVNWAGFNMINATKELIKDALKKYDDYTHLVLLSGMDYPIKSKQYIYDFFMDNKEVEFIRAFSITSEGKYLDIKKIKNYWFMDIYLSNFRIINKAIQKLLHYSFRFKRKNSQFIDKNNTVNEVCYGSQWWAITPKCAKYIIEYIESNDEIDRYFKYSFAPDEMYFHTIIFNSKFRYRTINKKIENNYGYWCWSNIHHIDPSLDKYFNELDIFDLNNSDKLFVRKVNTNNSSLLLEYLDENIINKR